jgi:hypothetical protein
METVKSKIREYRAIRYHRLLEAIEGVRKMEDVENGNNNEEHKFEVYCLKCEINGLQGELNAYERVLNMLEDL